MKGVIALTILFSLISSGISFPLYSCKDAKYKTCRKMSSCDEAMFYLKKCKLYRLDADGDGIPCECGVCIDLNPKKYRCKMYKSRY